MFENLLTLKNIADFSITVYLSHNYYYLGAELCSGKFVQMTWSNVASSPLTEKQINLAHFSLFCMFKITPVGY